MIMLFLVLLLYPFRLLLERIRVSSRAVLCTALLCNAMGVALLVDWQSLATDTQKCSQFSLPETPEGSFVECIPSDMESTIQSSGNYMNTNTTYEEQCRSSKECYWNPDSIITGKHCDTCPGICHSNSGSLNFIQVCIGVFFICLSIDMTRYTTMPLMSKFVPGNLKVMIKLMLILNFIPLMKNSIACSSGWNTCSVSSQYMFFKLLFYVYKEQYNGLSRLILIIIFISTVVSIQFNACMHSIEQ